MNTNPLHVPVLVLRGPLPLDAIISVEELARRHDAATIVEVAQRDAERLRKQAASELEQARQEADALRLTALCAAEREIEQLKQQARDNAVADAVQWLCSEQEIERQIARQLAMRWRVVTASVLDELLGKRDQDELLLRTVERKVEELLPHGQLALHVAPAALMATRSFFIERPEITVVADAELAAGQARLDSGLVRILLDMPAHRSWLLQQLASQDGEGNACLV